MDLSIIILSYNTAALTLKTLETVFQSLKAASFAYQVIVFDNASSDDSVKRLKEVYGERIQLIESPVNLGFSKGNNEAVKKASGRYLLFLNSDIEVQDAAIIDLYNFYLANQSKYGLLGGKLLNPDLTAQASAGPFYSLKIVLGALFFRGDYYGLTRYSPNQICRVDWVSGACFMTSQKIFKQLSGFDEQIFMYMEEIDLMYRANQAGIATGFFPPARFIHLGTGSAKDRQAPILNVYKGFLYFYKKHHNISENIKLRFLLKLKAKIGYNLGVLFKNSYLEQTYGQAEKLVDQAEKLV